MTAITSTKGRVVVTDDSRLIRRMLSDALPRQGAKDFVVKPFQAERVLDAVGKALA